MKRPKKSPVKHHARERATPHREPPPADEEKHIFVKLDIRLIWHPEVPTEERAEMESVIRQLVQDTLGTRAAGNMLKHITLLCPKWQIGVSYDEKEPEPAPEDVSGFL